MTDFVDTLTIKGRTDGVDQAKASVTSLGASVDETTRKVASYSSSLDKLQRSIDPVYAAQQKLAAAQVGLQKNVDAGNLTMDRATQLLLLAKARYQDQTEALTKTASAAKLTYTEMEILRSGMINTVQSMAAGVGAAKTLETQFFQTAPAITGVVRVLGGPMIAAIGLATVGIGGLVAGLALGISRAIEIEGQIRRLTVTMQAMGNVAGISGPQARGIAQGLYDRGVDRTEAVGTVQTILGGRSIQGDMIGQIAALVPDVAAGMGISIPEAAKKMTEAFDQGWPAIKKLDDQLDIFTTAQRLNIDTMAEHGRRTDVLAASLSVLKDRFTGLHEQALSPGEKAFRDLSRGWSSFVDAIAGSEPIIAMVTNLASAVGYMAEKVKGSGDGQAQERLKKGFGFLPGYSGLVDQMQAGSARPGAPGAIEAAIPGTVVPPSAKPTIDVALERSTKYTADLTKANTDLAGAMGKVGLARDLELAKVAALKEAKDKDISGDQAAILVQERQREVILRASGAIAEQTALAKLNAAATQGVVDAYMKSAAAGSHMESVLQATITVQKQGGSVTEETMRLDQAKADQARIAAAAQLPQLQQQVDAQERLSAATDKGAVALAEAARQNEVLAFKAALVAKGNDAESESVRVLVDQYDTLTKSKLAAEQRGASAAAIKQAQQDLQISQMQAAGSQLFAPEQMRAMDMAIDRQRTINELTKQWGTVADGTGKQLLDLYDAAAANRDVARFYGDVRQGAQQLAGDMKGFLLDGLTGAYNGGKSIFANLWDTALQGAKRFALNLALTFAQQRIFMPIAMGVVSQAPGLFGIAGPQGGGGGGGLTPIMDADGKVTGYIPSGGIGGGGMSAGGGGGNDAFGMLSQGYGIANSASQLSGNGSLLSNAGGWINDAFGGSGSSLFSGGGAFSQGAINQFGTNYLGTAGGYSSAVSDVVGSSTGAMEGLGNVGVAGAGIETTGTLGAMTLSEAIPFVGAAIGVITALAQGDYQGAAMIAGGAAIGTVIMPGIGTAVGAVLGGLVSAMLPSGQSAPVQDAYLQSTDNGRLMGGRIDSAKMKGRTPAAGILSAFATRANALADIYGLDLSGVPAVSSSMGLYAGKKGANEYYSIDPNRSKHYATAEEAEAASEKYIIGSRSITSSQGGFIGAAENATLARSAADSFEALAKELTDAVTAANHYEAVLNATGHASTQVQQDLSDMVDRFQKEAAEMAKYNLDVVRPGALVQAFGRQLDTAIADQIEQITDPFQFALDQQARDAQARLNVVTAFGGDIVQAERLNALERQKIVEQAEAQKNAAIIAASQQLLAYLNGQALGAGSTLSPTDKLAEAQRQFGAAAGAARLDPSKMQALTQAADTLLQIDRSVHASSVDYANQETFVRSTLTNIGHQLGLPGFAGGTDFAPGGPSIVGERGWEIVNLPRGSQVIPHDRSMQMAGNDNGPLLVAGFNAVVNEVRGLRAENQQLRAEVSRLTEWMKATG